MEWWGGGNINYIIIGVLFYNYFPFDQLIRFETYLDG